MTSRTSLNTNLLQIRNVTAYNPISDGFIEPFQIPVIGEQGQLQWYSSLQLLSSISIPVTSTNVLNLLESIQPGLSSVQSNFSTTWATEDWVSRSTLMQEINVLSYTYKYISATTLYDCFANLANMHFIGNELGPMVFGSNLTGGYVSTIYPGKYRNITSSIGFGGSNWNQLAFTNSSNVPNVELNINGFRNLLVSSTKLMVDINLNMNLNFQTGLNYTCYVSSFLTNKDTGAVVGQAQLTEIPFYFSNANIASAKFLLNFQDLTPFPSTLVLRHRSSNATDDPFLATTMVPTRNGMWVTLNNMD